MSDLAEVNNKSTVKISLAYLLQIVVLCSAAVWGYANTNEKIDFNSQEIRNLRGNQNNYVFPDIRKIEEQVIELEKEVLKLETELAFYKKELEKKQ